MNSPQRESGGIIIVAIMITIIIATLLVAASIFGAKPAGADNGWTQLGPHTIEFAGVSGATWTYTVTSNGPPAISNWGLGFCQPESEVIETSEPFEIVDPDPHYGFRTLKFDTGYSNSETRIVTFTMANQWQTGEVAIGLKAGRNVYTSTIAGPTCEPAAIKLVAFTNSDAECLAFFIIMIVFLAIIVVSLFIVSALAQE